MFSRKLQCPDNCSDAQTGIWVSDLTAEEEHVKDPLGLTPARPRTLFTAVCRYDCNSTSLFVSCRLIAMFLYELGSASADSRTASVCAWLCARRPFLRLLHLPGSECVALRCPVVPAARPSLACATHAHARSRCAISRHWVSYFRLSPCNPHRREADRACQ